MNISQFSMNQSASLQEIRFIFQKAYKAKEEEQERLYEQAKHSREVIFYLRERKEKLQSQRKAMKKSIDSSASSLYQKKSKKAKRLYQTNLKLNLILAQICIQKNSQIQDQLDKLKNSTYSSNSNLKLLHLLTHTLTASLNSQIQLLEQKLQTLKLTELNCHNHKQLLLKQLQEQKSSNSQLSQSLNELKDRLEKYERAHQILKQQADSKFTALKHDLQIYRQQNRILLNNKKKLMQCLNSAFKKEQAARSQRAQLLQSLKQDRKRQVEFEMSQQEQARLKCLLKSMNKK